MAMAEAEQLDGFEFLSDPLDSDRLPLPDLTGGDSILLNEPTGTLLCTPSESSIGDTGEAALTVFETWNAKLALSTAAVRREGTFTGEDFQRIRGEGERQFSCSWS
ncbi:hypothetical protein D1007_44346 [Hordeum vulgare]|nr:hypothetical protein D1007_44346 [Hordeum vulgare]